MYVSEPLFNGIPFRGFVIFKLHKTMNKYLSIFDFISILFTFENWTMYSLFMITFNSLHFLKYKFEIVKTIKK